MELLRGAYTSVIEELGDLPRVAHELLMWLGKERLIRFSSPMGGGKTTLISAMCAELGVCDNVSSPTFAIMNEYRMRTGEAVYHFDFYRIEQLGELRELGMQEILFDESSWRMIEWPEVGEELMPSGGVDVEIQVMPDGSRRVHAVKV